MMSLKKRWVLLLTTVLLCFGATACGTENNTSAESATAVSQNSTSNANDESNSENNNDTEKSTRQIKVTAENGDVIIFALNDSLAADDLYGQLPLNIEVKDYSDNEKIFYPVPLSTDNTPIAENKVGTLAYYKPWGDVVMFYGGFRQNNSLFELGHVVTGGGLIKNLSGTIKIEKVE